MESWVDGRNVYVWYQKRKILDFFHDCMEISSFCFKGNFRKPENLLTQRGVIVLDKVGTLSL